MANSKLLKEAIADAKAVKETAIANAKIALEEAFTPKLQSILSKKLQSEMEMDDEEDMEEVAEEVDSSDIGKGGEPKYDEAHTELDPETEKETAAPGEELDAVEKVDDLKEGEHSEDEVEETVSEENAEVKEETEVNEEEDSEEVDEMAHGDDEDEVDEELNLEDIIKELESELSEEEGDEEEVEEGEHGEEEMAHGEEEGMHGEEEMSHGEEEMKAGEDEMKDMEEEEDIDLDEILKEMGYGEEDDSEEEVDESNNQVEELSKELEEAYATVKELKKTINEVNLLNAKLLYANKLFRSYAMDNNQKSKVVETLDRTKSVREVKLVFATLAESMKFGGENKKVRVTEGIASKAQKSTAPKKEIISESNEVADRFKKLANIK